MANKDFIEGDLLFEIKRFETPCHTHYKVIGDLSSTSPRLIVLHGGPGTGHEYLLPFGCLWQQFGIPVVFYDQIGCAASSHLPQTSGDESFWQESLFIAELNNLLDVLQLRDGPGYFILGHSWGGRIAAAFATTRPNGLKGLVLASGIASTESWVKGVQMICKQFSSDAQLAIEEAEQDQSFESARFKMAMDIFLRNYFCRSENFPPEELLPALKNMSQDKTVRHTIAGPSPLNCTGSFRDWTCIPRLNQIDVPTLVYNGQFDTSHDVTTVPFFENIPCVRWITFVNAGHMCHLERPELTEKVFKVVGDFLSELK